MKISSRITALILVFVMIAATLIGCTTGGTQNNTPSSPEVTPEPRPLYIGRTAPVIEKAEEVTPTAQDFTVSRAFSNNMVLQRDDYIRIWGTSKDADGAIVCAEFMGLKGSAAVENGEWLITLDGTLSACTEQGNSLVVKGAEKETVFKNVLVGDVYMVIGQSNAAYLVANFMQDSQKDEEAHNAFTNKDITNDDNIRVIRNVMGDPMTKGDHTSELATDVNHRRGWQVPRTAANNTSAIGYFFAKHLVNKTNNEIPIGIIECSAAGCVLAAFMTPEVAEACGVDTYDEKKGGYLADSVNGMQESRVIYNQYINPFMNFTISGIVWYQGESDAVRDLPKAYADNFTALIKDYRDKIDQNYHDFPVYIIELPTEYQKPEDYKYTWAYIDVGEVRSYMGDIPAKLDNAFIAASSDLWTNREYWNSLHPYCKWPMAERAANLAMPILYESYAENTIEYMAAPTLAGAKKTSDTEVVLNFVYTGDGLKMHSGETAKGFEVLIGDTWIAPEYVHVANDTVIITHSEAFTSVRYFGITDNVYPEDVNVCSSTGVPMAAFCWDPA